MKKIMFGLLFVLLMYGCGPAAQEVQHAGDSWTPVMYAGDGFESMVPSTWKTVNDNKRKDVIAPDERKIHRNMQMFALSSQMPEFSISWAETLAGSASSRFKKGYTIVSKGEYALGREGFIAYEIVGTYTHPEENVVFKERVLVLLSEDAAQFAIVGRAPPEEFGRIGEAMELAAKHIKLPEKAPVEKGFWKLGRVGFDTCEAVEPDFVSLIESVCGNTGAVWEWGHLFGSDETSCRMQGRAELESYEVGGYISFSNHVEEYASLVDKINQKSGGMLNIGERTVEGQYVLGIPSLAEIAVHVRGQRSSDYYVIMEIPDKLCSAGSLGALMGGVDGLVAG